MSDDADYICEGCEYQEMFFCDKAEDYGGDGVGYYCNRKEYGVERCPNAHLWCDFFDRKRKREEAGHGTP